MINKNNYMPVFLSVLGGKTYSLLCNLLFPALPKEKQVDVLPPKNQAPYVILLLIC